mmetsp:Transcript_103577/g.221538  ORF Transcript_103577/g.221538 Transcript_103577/m.221538 type:complete len:232 (+) Transcript_103577:494-1189(+)
MVFRFASSRAVSVFRRMRSCRCTSASYKSRLGAKVKARARARRPSQTGLRHKRQLGQEARARARASGRTVGTGLVPVVGAGRRAVVRLERGRTGTGLAMAGMRPNRLGGRPALEQVMYGKREVLEHGMRKEARRDARREAQREALTRVPVKEVVQKLVARARTVAMSLVARARPREPKAIEIVPIARLGSEQMRRTPKRRSKVGRVLLLTSGGGLLEQKAVLGQLQVQPET